MPGKFCCGEGEEGPAANGRAYLWCVYGDWCSYFALFFVYASLLTIYVSTILFCIQPMYGLDNWLGLAHLSFFNTIVVLVLVSHLSASWSDPGLVARETSDVHVVQYQQELAELEKSEGVTQKQLRKFKRKFCRHCKVFKPQGAHHCSTCHRCVREMDHHCPWINNCVGERNLKMFYLFLIYTTIGTGYAIAMFSLRVHGLIQGNAWRARIPHEERQFYITIIILCVVAALLAVFFFIFVLCMCYDQYEALTTGVPGIETMSYEGDIPWKQSCPQGFRTMAQRREPFGWRWFIPIAARMDVAELHDKRE